MLLHLKRSSFPPFTDAHLDVEPAQSASPTTRPARGTSDPKPGASLLFWEQPLPASLTGAPSCRQPKVTKLSARADSSGWCSRAWRQHGKHRRNQSCHSWLRLLRRVRLSRQFLGARGWHDALKRSPWLIGTIRCRVSAKADPAVSLKDHPSLP